LTLLGAVLTSIYSEEEKFLTHLCSPLRSSLQQTGVSAAAFKIHIQLSWFYLSTSSLAVRKILLWCITGCFCVAT